MPFRRALSIIVASLACAAASLSVRGEDSGAAAVASSLCNSLLASMKQGPALDFAARSKLLSPEIRRDLDLALMTRLVVGPPWRTMTSADKDGLAAAFSDYSVATYAQRFKSYSGERFEVDPSPAPLPKGDCVVHTKLFTGGPDPVQLDYLMRKTGDDWRIIDVYLSGSISELAARRSEYSAVIREGGAAALIGLLKKKTADFGG